MAEIVVNVIVIAPPAVLVTPASQTVRPGELLVMQCQARGTLPINIEWSKVGGAISPSATEQDGLLEIRRVTAADTGRYRCVAVNDAGRGEGYAEVAISGKFS